MNPNLQSLYPYADMLYTFLRALNGVYFRPYPRRMRMRLGTNSYTHLPISYSWLRAKITSVTLYLLTTRCEHEATNCRFTDGIQWIHIVASSSCTRGTENYEAESRPSYRKRERRKEPIMELARALHAREFTQLRGMVSQYATTLQSRYFGISIWTSSIPRRSPSRIHS